jgi:hypothetical protein
LSRRKLFVAAALLLAASCGQKTPHGDAHGSGSAHAGGHQAGGDTRFLFPNGNDGGWANLSKSVAHHAVAFTATTTLPAAIRAQLAHQLSLVEDAVRKYPTVADATAARYVRAGPFRPGTGAHYGRADLLIRGTALTDEAISNPAVLIYDGTSPDSRIAGVMYVFSDPVIPGKTAEPEGFAGSGDRWHFHENNCTREAKDGGLDLFRSSAAECARAKGTFMQTGGYGIHVWPVAAYANPLGVFAHANPALSCPDGTYFTGPEQENSLCKRASPK